jgi:hypothetical protein
VRQTSTSVSEPPLAVTSERPGGVCPNEDAGNQVTTEAIDEGNPVIYATTASTSASAPADTTRPDGVGASGRAQTKSRIVSTLQLLSLLLLTCAVVSLVALSVAICLLTGLTSLTG